MGYTKKYHFKSVSSKEGRYAGVIIGYELILDKNLKGSKLLEFQSCKIWLDLILEPRELRDYFEQILIANSDELHLNLGRIELSLLLKSIEVDLVDFKDEYLVEALIELVTSLG